MKKLIAFVVLASALSANAGILKFTAKHVVKPTAKFAVKATKKTAKAGAHAVKKTAKVAKKVIV